MNKPAAYSPDQKLRLYLIHKAQKQFGPDAVSHVTYDEKDVPGVARLYFYADGTSYRIDDALKHASIVFADKLFNDESALNYITVDIAHVKGGELTDCYHPDEQLYRLKIQGNAAEILSHIRENDVTGLTEAMASHSAQEILRREENWQMSL